MKISASIYSQSEHQLEDVVRRLDQFGVDAFHLDSAHDLSVFEDIRRIRAVSHTPIDLHVISSDPTTYFDPLLAAGLEYAAFQYENLTARPDFPKNLSSRTQLGLSILPTTPVSVFEDYEEDCSYLMLMTTTPGKSGGVFDPDTLARIVEVHERFPQIQIHVDGGVNQLTSEALRGLSVEWAVSGSYLLGADNTPEALMKLRTRLESGEAPVTSFMRRLNELPCLTVAEANDPERLLEKMESRRLGFCIVLSETGNLHAVVSDGDVRRAAMRSLTTGGAIKAEDLLNRRPLSVQEETTLNELFHLMMNHPRPMGFVPVNNNAGALVGCISFNDLMRGVA